MEWKSIKTNKPKPGSICVVVDAKGLYSLKRYAEVYVYDRGRQTKRWSIDKEEPYYPLIGKKFEFVSARETCGALPRKDCSLFFCEIPPAPEKALEAKEIQEQIRELEKRLEALGGNK